MKPLQYFKLVPVDKTELQPKEPFVIVCGPDCFLPNLNISWANHIAGGSAGVYNIDGLILAQADHDGVA